MYTVLVAELLYVEGWDGAWEATRTIEMPTPPFVGLELYFTPIIRLEIEHVLYNVETGLWEVYPEDTVLRPPEEQRPIPGVEPETIEAHIEWFIEAGFVVDEVSMADLPPPRRHLRLVAAEPAPQDLE